MLEIKDAVVRSGSFRLGAINLDVAHGECHAILGPSGSGKTTLLRAILGTAPLEKGSIFLQRVDLAGVPIEHRGLGYLPQNLGLFPHLSVRKNIEYSARARRVPRATFEPIVRRLVAATGVEALLDRRPDTLSGGERQRVGLVRALASRPRVVLLDEPFTALEATLRREIWALLQDLRRHWDLTTLMVTHDLAEAYFLADRVTVLLDGRVVQQGSRDDVFRRPMRHDVAAFVGVENLVPAKRVASHEALVWVDVQGIRLLAQAPAGVNDDTLLCIRAEDVIILANLPTYPASGFDEHADGRTDHYNRLPARIESVQHELLLTRVVLDVGFRLQALISRPSAEATTLRPNQKVTVLLPASKLHLTARAAE
jgi:ABC-type Fe3+/spermidine/putrescine transport system ATPase subunit